MGTVVGTREGDELLARIVYGVGRKDAVDLVVLEHGLARVRSDLRELELGLVTQDIAGQELRQAGIEAIELAVGVVALREERGGLDPAHEEPATVLDGLRPNIGLNEGVIGDLACVQQAGEGGGVDRRRGRGATRATGA